MKKTTLILLTAMMFIHSSTALAGKPEKRGNPHEASSASERVGDEIADSVADALTHGTKTTTTTKERSLPPGLAKKDKLPPGWDKGKKTGWTKEETTTTDSPIRKFFKNLFGNKN